MQLPLSQDLEIKYLSKLFSDRSQSYKFFWFQAILTKVLEGKIELTFNELINEMVVNAWYMVTEYHLNLGLSDSLEKLVLHLQEVSGIKSCEKREKIIEYLEGCTDRDTLAYYDANADAFVDRTKLADLSELYKEFLPHIPEGGKILDLGCGSGRDSLHFLKLGYEVVAIDGSEAMCLEAEKVIGQSVQHIDIMEMDMQEKFHGIWACASLLHLTKEELKKVLPELMEILLPDGILYGSWKYGEEKRIEDGRYFQDFTEDGLRAIFSELGDCTVQKYWISEDVRADKSSVKWSNILIRKMND